MTSEKVTQSNVDEEWCEEWCEECFPSEPDHDLFCWECMDEHGEVDL